MADIVIVARPAGQREEYLFVSLVGSTQVFKVTKELQTSASGQLVVSLGVSPVDENGTALLNPAGLPDIVYHSHTFTAEELSNPDFDTKTRVFQLIGTLVEKKSNEIAAREKVAALDGSWEVMSV